jgi:hypothetical protein
MAHFAEIDNGIVTRVIVADSLDWCETNLGGVWLQTSYSGLIRKNFAGIGFTYNVELDAFISPNPECHPEVELDLSTCKWVCLNDKHKAI